MQKCALTFLCLLIAPLSSWSQEAFVFRSNQLVVDAAAHWSQWSYQNDRVDALATSMPSSQLFDIDARSIKPRFFPGRQNYVVDARQFIYPDAGGIEVQGHVSALSNNRLAERIADGDLSTFWEPEDADFSQDALGKWQILVDLGRTVWADSIVVLVPSDGAIPQALKLELSTGKVVADSEGNFSYEFVAAGDVEIAASDRRLVYHLQPLENADADMDGAPDLSGTFLHFARLSIVENDFEAGQRPRLSEIEVWGPGPNLAYLPERRAGASFEDGGLGLSHLATDGVYGSLWFANAWSPLFSTNHATDATAVRGTMWLDLGASFWVERIYVGSVQMLGSQPFYGLHLLGSDGTGTQSLHLQEVQDFAQLEVELQWDDLVSEGNKDNNQSKAFILGERFAQRPLRFFQVRNIDPTDQKSGQYGATSNLNELQMYGQGYPARLSFVSPPIVLHPDSRKERLLSRLAWEADAAVHRVDAAGRAEELVEPLDLHPEVQLLVQTRTSNVEDILVTYYEIIGGGTNSETLREIDVETYRGLEAQWQAFFIWDGLPEERIIVLQNHQSERDDDGDGVVDEDPIDGIDNDGDNLLDEDGLSGDVGGPNDQGTITLLKHRRRADDDFDGAEDEDPIDGIDNDGDNLIDEDGRKLSRPRTEPQRVSQSFIGAWSSWSAPYRIPADRESAAFASPSPARFFQIRVTIASGDPHSTAQLRSLRVILDEPTAILEESVSLPQRFVLEENYPNPFNPTTTIRFHLPQAVPVRLDIYDVLGQRVRTLVDERVDAGVYRADWDGRAADGGVVGSGLYFYRLQAGEFAQVRRMLLLK